MPDTFAPVLVASSPATVCASQLSPTGPSARYPIISSGLSSNGSPRARVRQPILYGEQMWRQQRFFAGFLILVGLIVPPALIIYKQPLNWIWLFYVPSGLVLGGGFLLYRWRSFMEPMESGLKVSTLFANALIGYDTIKQVKVQPLKLAFQEKRKRMVAPIMKPLMEKPALFVRLRGDEEELAAVRKRLGARLFFEDTIALPVPDPDAAAWEITSRLPERLGQNLGGRRRKRRR